MISSLKYVWVERILYLGKYSRLCGEFLLASFCRTRQKSKTPSDRIFWHFLRIVPTIHEILLYLRIIKGLTAGNTGNCSCFDHYKKIPNFYLFQFSPRKSSPEGVTLKRKRGKLGDNFPRLEICSEAALPPSTKSFCWVFSDCKKSRAFLWPTSLSVFTSPGANGIKLPLMAIYEMHFAEV